MKYPYIPQKTTKNFVVPKTLAADFSEFLRNDIPHTVMDFTLLKNWYDQFEENYVPTVIRGMLYTTGEKSHYSNSDNKLNFRAEVDSGIQKGDIVISEDGIIYILDWEVSLQSNNAPSRASICNMELTIKRNVPEQVDKMGYLIEPEHEETIVDALPVNAYRYEGRPEYVSASSSPGVTPNSITTLTVQYNDQTKNIRIDDVFTWGGFSYTVVDINNFDTNEITKSGCLILQAKRTAGGIL